MIESLRDHADGAVLDADLCILGAGAAGIAIARELRSTPLRVLVAEGGGLDGDPGSQALYEGESAGALDYALAATRMRFFGGSTNCWTGFCTPLDPSDFETREWVPESGWPLDRATLEPFYRRAQPLLDLGPFFYDADRLPGLRAFLPEKLRNTLWQHSPPTRFGARYRDELAGAPRVRVLLHANVTEIVTGADGRRATEVRVRSLEGPGARLRARAFVLATGGIENPRLLLLSRGVDPRGIGNRHDRVGRYFMEHAVVPAAAVTPAGPDDWPGAYRRLALPGGGAASAAIGPSLAAQRAHRILNAVVTLAPGRVDLDAGYLALGRIRRALAEGALPDEPGTEIRRVLTDIDDVARGLWAKLRDEPYAPGVEDAELRGVSVHVEQAPDPESRVSLSGERDALGLPRARLSWRLGERERETVRVATRLLAEELGRLGLGRLRRDEWVDAETLEWPIALVKCHHMGTTRMASDPRRGVVDADCRVHGVENLYVAGSSVFPTSGFANPTLTLVALALRLADHLKAKLG